MSSTTYIATPIELMNSASLRVKYLDVSSTRYPLRWIANDLRDKVDRNIRSRCDGIIISGEMMRDICEELSSYTLVYGAVEFDKPVRALQWDLNHYVDIVNYNGNLTVNTFQASADINFLGLMDEANYKFTLIDNGITYANYNDYLDQ